MPPVLSGYELVTADHSCVVFEGESEFTTAVVGFLSEGLTRGEQVGYFGWGNRDELRRRLRGLGDVDELEDGQGALLVTSLDEHYRRDRVPDPATRLAFWSDATDRSLAAGFMALRVVTETTPWLNLAEQRDRFLRSEGLLDRYAHEHPLTLMCACDGSILDRDAVAEIASIHASTLGVSSPFHLHAAQGADFALRGETDTFTAPVLARVLACLPRVDATPELVIDASGLDFIEHRSLLTLEDLSGRLGLTALILRDAPAPTGQLIELLGLHLVRVEGSP